MAGHRFGTLEDAMVSSLERAAHVDLSDLNSVPRHHMDSPLPSSQYGFQGLDNWNGYGKLTLGHDGVDYSALGDYGATYLERVRRRRKNRKARWARQRKKIRERNKRIWRRHVARRRAWCKKHSKFCNWWQKNWNMVVSALIAIVGAIVSIFTFGTGAAVAAVLIGLTQAAVSAGKKTQDCMKAKKKNCWKAGLGEFGSGVANTALENAGRMSDKFGVNIGLTPAMQNKFKQLMNTPAYKKMKDLYNRIEKGVDSKTKEKIMDEINALDDQIHDQFSDFEGELDDLFWLKGGFKREWNEEDVLVREDKKGDKWVMWDSDREPPDGIEEGIWYRMSGDTASKTAGKKAGDTQLATDIAAAEVASRASTLEKSKGIPPHKTVTTAAGKAKRPPLKGMPRPTPLGAAKKARIVATLTEKQKLRLAGKNLYQVGPAVVAATSADEAEANLAQSAAEGDMSEETARSLGFSKLYEYLPAIGIGVAAAGTALLIALAVRRRRG